MLFFAICFLLLYTLTLAAPHPRVAKPAILGLHVQLEDHHARLDSRDPVLELPLAAQVAAGHLTLPNRRGFPSPPINYRDLSCWYSIVKKKCFLKNLKYGFWDYMLGGTHQCLWILAWPGFMKIWKFTVWTVSRITRYFLHPKWIITPWSGRLYNPVTFHWY